MICRAPRRAAVVGTAAFVIMGCATAGTSGTDAAAGNSGTAGGSAGVGGSVGSGGQTGHAGAGGTTGSGGASGTGGNTSGVAGASGGAAGAGGLGGQGGSAGIGGRGGGQAGASGRGGGGGAGAGGEGGGGAGTGGNTSSVPWISFDASTVVARSNIVLAAPNATPTQFMPLGNGTLGAAVWASNGFAAQLNRADTMPDRKSIGLLAIPGLARLTNAADYRGTLDLYNAVLVQSGGGMTARAYVRADSDELVVDVTGADPGSTQTATVSLWSTRSPQAQASGAIGTLSESWTDSTSLGGSNQRFGSLAALTAGGRNVAASTGTRSIRVSFQPNADGSFRIVCGAPKFNGGTASTIASTLLGNHATAPAADLERGHLAWWHAYWGRLGMVKMTSTDGSAEYVENLRAVYLYANAAESRGAWPGSQAGIANLFAFTEDHQPWFPAGFWFWNLRMQVAANLGAGAFDMNAPVFNLYLSNLANMQAWTRARMGNRPGICLPETMRFNGNGYYAYSGNQSCDQTITPSWNSLTITSGAEVGLWVWQQYLMTGDRAFLQAHYPLMAEAARFLLAYATQGSDGLLHTRSNAHEHQWDVNDPVSDVAAMRALFPAVVSAAETLATDAQLVTELQAAIPRLRPIPRTNSGRTQVLGPSDDASNNTIFAYSAQPTVEKHNVENLDLEPVWPFSIVGDTSGEFAVARRTYMQRAYKNQPDWTYDPVHAARVGLPDEVASTLTAGIGKFQVYASGLAAWDPADMRIPYIEHAGVLATAVHEAIAQDYDGLLRIAPAWPTRWSLSGTVFIRGRSRLHVHFQNGALAFAVLEAGTTGTVNVRNPWSGEQATVQATVIDSAGQNIVPATTAATLSVSAQQGGRYLIKRSGDATPAPLQVTGTAATAVKRFNSRTIGVP
jgi:hypothetical protein